MATTPIRIGTRGSQLALRQASEVRSRLMAAHGMEEDDFEIEVVSTMGDRILDRPLSEVGGKGLFTKEIEEGLLDGRLDIAVHSSKDMATVLPAGLTISAYLEREDARDCFIGRTAERIADLPQGAVVGSASLRRQALVKRMRPDIEVVTFRGNVQTRLRKLNAGEVDGTLLALSGLKRMAMEDVATDVLPVETFPPAPGQGAICIESREGDGRIEAMLAPIRHRETTIALTAERAFLAGLDGSCRTPIAAYARLDGETLRLFGMILTPDGRTAHETEREGPAGEAGAIGQAAARELLDRAGPEFFESWA